MTYDLINITIYEMKNRLRSINGLNRLALTTTLLLAGCNEINTVPVYNLEGCFNTPYSEENPNLGYFENCYEVRKGIISRRSVKDYLSKHPNCEFEVELDQVTCR
ncbi:MAG: hypothetical protein US39_C0016G0031 [Microgenomates group bacterium GW2011_GWC1_37_12b]|uniref:Uncharacterized protein n=2 Tax=Candidatus Woeseibacteriota TaxID=1752722 RepID=A0A0G0NM69_9BACT|nr:MAG: hypothetical protein US39_C0016G0031 [Microgenomates group bacterium GW2011_GWC1_37_12b]KKQ87014.1 MAG: hypothetical protein UT10_C0012G0002 [Candidatus Woesebacteria bacterium GW2011_GWB1_38_8b]